VRFTMLFSKLVQLLFYNATKIKFS
jgi:hypothetical protein